EGSGGGSASLLGVAGGFGRRAHGVGQVVVGVFGATDVIDLQPGEQVTIDTGHVVAYDLMMHYTIRRAVSGRSIQSLISGEGFVFDFVGPGRVLLQTRNPRAFAAWAVSASGAR